MKENLLQLLNSNPATAGRPSDFLEALAEDIQAVIIRAIVPAPYEDHVAELEHHVTDVHIVLAMIQTLLNQQDYVRQQFYSETE